MLGANTVEPRIIKHTKVKVVEVEKEVEVIVEVPAECDKPADTIAQSDVEPTYQTFEATAYTADCAGCIGITKTGYDVRNTVKSPKGYRVIAVDPSVIPLGSLVEIRLADGTTIKARAMDTGGKIRGNRIDLLKATRDKALQFGRQDVELRILN